MALTIIFPYCQIETHYHKQTKIPKSYFLISLIFDYIVFVVLHYQFNAYRNILPVYIYNYNKPEHKINISLILYC